MTPGQRRVLAECDGEQELLRAGDYEGAVRYTKQCEREHRRRQRPMLVGMIVLVAWGLATLYWMSGG